MTASIQGEEQSLFQEEWAYLPEEQVVERSPKRKRDECLVEAKKPKLMITLPTKIISGGQTGADRGGLEAAEAMGISTGGMAPYGYKTCDGKDPELGTRFGLMALPYMNLRRMYVRRSCINVDISDATVAFRFWSSFGTDKTIGYCKTGRWVLWPNEVARPYRPVFVVTDFERSTIEELRFWLSVQSPTIRTLNIAGHRESTAPVIPGVQFKDAVKAFLCAVFEAR